jgi:hypothetical protein
MPRFIPTIAPPAHGQIAHATKGKKRGSRK